MDLYKIRPIEDQRLVKDQPLKAAPQQDRAPVRSAEPASEQPREGGVTATPENQAGETRDATTEARIRERIAKRREVLEEFARYANVPPETRLAIAVDVESDQTRFQVIDKETGEILKEIPEREGVTLLQRLMQHGASLLDESF